MQLLDDRTIWAFKLKYLKFLILYIILRLNDDKWATDIINEINILKAVVWIKAAWEEVSPEAAFQRCS